VWLPPVCIFSLAARRLWEGNTAFQGNILAGTAVVFDPGTQITCGRAFTDTAAGTDVTFAGNNPGTPTGTPNLVSDTCVASSSGYNGGVISLTGSGGTAIVTAVPEPSAFVLFSSVLFAMVFLTFRKSAA
jgi:hypothetical protein